MSRAETAKELLRKVLIAESAYQNAKAVYDSFNDAHGSIFTSDHITYDDGSQHYHTRTWRIINEQ